MQQARREGTPIAYVEIADHFGSVAEITASSVAASLLAHTARTLEATVESSVVAARMQAKLQLKLRRDPVLGSMAKALQARRPPFRTESRSSDFAEEPRTCRFR
ncbi:MAG TPA: hypothetical protein VLX85_13455 [Stellaceae bacterium]|nr:hypothetical protein [Stellaceae bacterium]